MPNTYWNTQDPINDNGLLDSNGPLHGDGLIDADGPIHGDGLIDADGPIHGDGLIDGNGPIHCDTLIEGIGPNEGDGRIHGDGPIHNEASVEGATSTSLPRTSRTTMRRTLRAVSFSFAMLGATTLISLSACSTSSTDLVHLPDGQSGFAVNCSGSGSGSSWGECYDRAGAACGANGYDIVSKDNDDGAAAGGGVSNLATANVKSRSMIVKCK